MIPSLLTKTTKIFCSLKDRRASLVAQTVKRLPTMRETWVRKIPWRRKWQPTPVLLPGKFHGQRNLVNYSPRGRKESGTTERCHFTSLHFTSLQANILSLAKGPVVKDKKYSSSNSNSSPATYYTNRIQHASPPSADKGIVARSCPVVTRVMRCSCPSQSLTLLHVGQRMMNGE